MFCNNFIEELKCNNVVFYGAGSMARKVLKILKPLGITPIAVCDSNPNMWGKSLDGIDICNYNDIKKKYEKYIIVMSVAINNAVQIRKILEESGEKNKIIHMQCPFKVDTTLLENGNSLKEYRNFFSDELSKKIYDDFLKYKMTGNMESMLNYLDGDSFFDETIITERKNHTYIDVGCYTGDTIAKFLMFCDNSYNKIIGMDADPGNAEAAKKFLEYSRIKNAEIINMGAWSEHSELVFKTIKNNDQLLFDSPNLFEDTEEMLSSRFNDIKEKDIYKEIKIDCDSLDALFENHKPTLIKVNALAADLPILEGAKKIISKHRPYIVLEYGTRPEYIEGTLKLFEEYCKNYCFYLRVKEIFGDIKTVLYAVPNK